MDTSPSSYLQNPIYWTNLFNNGNFDLCAYILNLEEYSFDNISFRFKDNIFKSFQIDLENYFKMEFYLIHKSHCTFSELDNIDYYRYQYYVQNLNEYIEKENEKNNEDQNEYSGRINKYIPKTSDLKYPEGMPNYGGASNLLSNISMPTF